MAKSLSELDLAFQQERAAAAKTPHRFSRNERSITIFAAVSAIVMAIMIALSGGLSASAPVSPGLPPVSSAPTVSTPISDLPSAGQEAPEEKPMRTVSGTVSWRHGDNPQAEHPDQASVQILRGTETAAELTVFEADDWNFTVDLPRYGEEGAEIVYTFQGGEIPGYRAVSREGGVEYVYEDAGAGPKTAGPAACCLWLVLTLASALALKEVIERRRRE